MIMQQIANKSLNDSAMQNLPTNCEVHNVDWARKIIMDECTTLQDFIDYEEAMSILSQYDS